VETECNTRVDVGALGRRTITADFSGEQISSDGGAILLRLAEERTGIVAAFARCFRDHRNPTLIKHTVGDLVAQRVFGLVLGYEDLVDHDALRKDPLLAAVVGKTEPEADVLAGKSTLNRLELTTNDAPTSRYKRIELDDSQAKDYLVDQFVLSKMEQDEAPAEIVLDFDNSDIPLFGHQEGRFFHAYYGGYCYLPLYVFCGEHLVSVRLQTADKDPARHAVEELERIVPRVRAVWPGVRIVVRGDSGFCRDAIFSWCEANDVDFVIGVARNSRLEAEVADALEEAKALHEETGEASRVFRELRYQTLDSWTRERRVVAKAEWLNKGANPRFVVTSYDKRENDEATVYERIYCARGEMENRIKENQLYLFGTRASTQTIQANQIRLFFSAVACSLVQSIRRLGLRGTDLAAARADTIRTKLLKIGARVEVTVRRVWIALSSACPYAATFVAAVNNLRAVPG
jgi:hypothetical protein